MSTMIKIDERNVRIITDNNYAENYWMVEGSELPFYYVPSVNDTDFKTNPNSHFWSMLSVYSDRIAELYNMTRENGGFKDSPFGRIYDAYTVSGMYVTSIPDEAFRTSLRQNFKLTVPITGGTGTLSGVTSLDLIAGLFSQEDSRTKSSKGFCGTCKADTALSDYHPIWNETGIGQKYEPGINPDKSLYGGNLYQSGYVALFSDLIDWSGATTGVTWSTDWSGTSRYCNNARMGVTKSSSYNEAVGVLDLNSGLVCLYHPDIVNNLNTAIATGGTATTGLTFSSTDVTAILTDRDVSTKVQVNVIIEAGAFGVDSSTNPSIAEASEDGSCEDKTYITSLCFHNALGEITAMGFFNEPVVKAKDDFVSAVANIYMDGGPKSETLVTNGRTIYPI